MRASESTPTRNDQAALRGLDLPICWVCRGYTLGKKYRHGQVLCYAYKASRAGWKTVMASCRVAMPRWVNIDSSSKAGGASTFTAMHKEVHQPRGNDRVQTNYYDEAPSRRLQYEVRSTGLYKSAGTLPPPLVASKSPQIWVWPRHQRHQVSRNRPMRNMDTPPSHRSLASPST